MNSIIAISISFVLSLIVTAVLGYFLIPILHKLKFGQNILVDIGPKWHAKKQGTPTMGGIMFIIGTIVVTALTLLTCKLAGFDAFAELEVLRNQQMTRLFAGMTSKFSRSSRNICGSRTTGTPRGMAIKPCCRMHGNSSAASKYA